MFSRQRSHLTLPAVHGLVRLSCVIFALQKDLQAASQQAQDFTSKLEAAEKQAKDAFDEAAGLKKKSSGDSETFFSQDDEIEAADREKDEEIQRHKAYILELETDIISIWEVQSIHKWERESTQGEWMMTECR